MENAVAVGTERTQRRITHRPACKMITVAYDIHEVRQISFIIYYFLSFACWAADEVFSRIGDTKTSDWSAGMLFWCYATLCDETHFDVRDATPHGDMIKATSARVFSGAAESHPPMHVACRAWRKCVTRPKRHAKRCRFPLSIENMPNKTHTHENVQIQHKRPHIRDLKSILTHLGGPTLKSASIPVHTDSWHFTPAQGATGQSAPGSHIRSVCKS